MEIQKLFNGNKESINHKLGKELARQKLFELGYSPEEIKFEYSVRFKTGKMRRVDVVGINNYKKTAIEIGNLTGGSLEELYVFFDEVYHLPKISSDNLVKIGELINKILEREDNQNEFNKNDTKFYEDQVRELTDYVLNNCETIPGIISDGIIGINIETPEGKQFANELREIAKMEGA